MNDYTPYQKNRPELQDFFRTQDWRDIGWSRCVACAILIVSALTCCRAQSVPTASRLGDLQVGGGFVFGHSNYNFSPTSLVGAGAYMTFDLRPHLGGEFSFRQTKSTLDSTVYERTFEIGPRVLVHRGPLAPYAKALYGRGIYNFHDNLANIAYNIYTFGGGADLSLTRTLNVRADYEYQSWAGFPLGTLHPNIVTIGLAYRFHEYSRMP